jgi:GNAT superfamily N-acetyltransferase
MPNDIHVRIADIADIETIAELNTAMAWETEQKRLDPATIRRGIRAVMDDSHYGFYVVAEQNGEVVGCLLITYEWSDWRAALFWWIQSLYVQPPFRRRGVFTRLHEFVKTQALQRPEVWWRARTSRNEPGSPARHHQIACGPRPTGCLKNAPGTPH